MAYGWCYLCMRFSALVNAQRDVIIVLARDCAATIRVFPLGQIQASLDRREASNFVPPVWHGFALLSNWTSTWAARPTTYSTPTAKPSWRPGLQRESLTFSSSLRFVAAGAASVTATNQARSLAGAKSSLGDSSTQARRNAREPSKETLSSISAFGRLKRSLQRENVPELLFECFGNISKISGSRQTQRCACQRLFFINTSHARRTFVVQGWSRDQRGHPLCQSTTWNPLLA